MRARRYRQAFSSFSYLLLEQSGRRKLRRRKRRQRGELEGERR
jgi:hypothetical protein